jgi:hypothetical protein
MFFMALLSLASFGLSLMLVMLFRTARVGSYRSGARRGVFAAMYKVDRLAVTATASLFMFRVNLMDAKKL